MSAIRAEGVSKAFGAKTALCDVSLSIDPGELFCLFGPPACGKTTLLRIMLGLDAADAGEVFIDGRAVGGVSPGQRNLATVFQNLALFPHLTAHENIAFPLRERGVARAEANRAVLDMADKLKLGHVLHKRPAQLSGGERQRVAIGRALVRPSAAVLMDEPISALDARLREAMRVQLKAMQRGSGLTVVYVTHDQEEALSVADRICILNAGSVEQVGPPKDIYNEPASRFVAEVMGSPRLNVFEAGPAPGGHALLVGGLGVEVTPLAGRGPGHAAPLLVGIRPECFKVGRLAAAGRSSPCRVTHVEPLGGTTVVGGTIMGVPVRILAGGAAGLVVGDEVPVSLVDEPACIFDAASGRRLQNGRASAAAPR